MNHFIRATIIMLFQLTSCDSTVFLSPDNKCRVIEKPGTDVLLSGDFENRNHGTFTLGEVNSATTNRPQTSITRINNVRDNLLYEIANKYSMNYKNIMETESSLSIFLL